MQTVQAERAPATDDHGALPQHCPYNPPFVYMRRNGKLLLIRNCQIACTLMAPSGDGARGAFVGVMRQRALPPTLADGGGDCPSPGAGAPLRLSSCNYIAILVCKKP